MTTAPPRKLHLYHTGITVDEWRWDEVYTSEFSSEHTVMLEVWTHPDGQYHLGEMQKKVAKFSATIDGHTLIANITLPRWTPQPDWRFALGAKTGASFQVHRVKEASLIAGRVLLYRTRRLAWQLTRNDQEFRSPSDYAFREPPTVSAFSLKHWASNGRDLNTLMGCKL